MLGNGPERILEKILSEGRASADAILADAERRCAETEAAARARAEETKTRLTQDAERRGTELIARARAEATAKKTGALLAARAELLDGVFDHTREELCRRGGDKYEEVLSGLLAAALWDRASLEAQASAYSDEGEEALSVPEHYEAMFNPADREKYGTRAVEAARARLTGKVPAQMLDRLILSDKTVPIDGGVILRCGEIETNCSFSLLFSELRRELQGQVAHALFDETRPT